MAVKATINGGDGWFDYVMRSTSTPIHIPETPPPLIRPPVEIEDDTEEEETDEEDYELYDLQKVTLEEMPFCCGIRILGDALDSATEDQIVEDIRAFIGAHSDDGDGKPGLLLYTAKKSQERESKALQRLKFTILQEFENPKTGNTVRLWGRLVNQ